MKHTPGVDELEQYKLLTSPWLNTCRNSFKQGLAFWWLFLRHSYDISASYNDPCEFAIGDTFNDFATIENKFGGLRRKNLSSYGKEIQGPLLQQGNVLITI